MMRHFSRNNDYRKKFCKATIKAKHADKHSDFYGSCHVFLENF
jgi:hypothetical protein